jgi:hypothetical protein
MAPQIATATEALTQHIAALVAQRKLLVAERITLESQGTQPEPPRAGTSVADRARHYLNGYATLPAVGQNAAERLYDIIIDVGGIDAALSDLARLREAQLVIDAQAAAQALEPAWHDLKRRLCLWAEQGKALEQAVFDMAQGIGGNLLSDRQWFGSKSILNIRWDSEPASGVIEAAKRAGVITREELERAKKSR